MRKRLLASVLSVATAVTMLAGCGSSTASSTASDAASKAASTTATASTTASTAAASTAATASSDGTELVVASVNNDPFMALEKHSDEFTKETGIKVKFEILSENEVRAKIQQDVGLGGGNYDLVTLGTTDMATYLNSKWTISLDDEFAKMNDADKKTYNTDDIFPSVLQSCKDVTTGKLAALPFYSESTMICYNKEIFDALNLKMPDNPTWDDIKDLAQKCDGYTGNGYNNVAGIAIRGKSGYGENQYIFSSIMNSFGGQYYDKDWNTTYDSEEVRNAWKYYKDLLGYAEDSPTTCGYTECLNLFAQGQAAIYYDATVSAGTFEADASAVKGKVGYAPAPSEKAALSSTIGGWGMAITAGSKHQDEAFKFLTWATSSDYIKLVGDSDGWTTVPSGTRKSLYTNTSYTAVAPFAEMTAKSIENAKFDHPAIGETPYVGTSLPNLPEYSSWGTTLGEELSAYVAGSEDLDTAIGKCKDAIDTAAVDGGYRS